MPPPVHLVNVRSTVFETGFTFLVEDVGGRPGLYVCVPENNLHFGTPLFVGAPAELAVITPTGRQSATAKSRPRNLRMQTPLEWTP